jgi:hypothetical protein
MGEEKGERERLSLATSNDDETRSSKDAMM